MKHQVDESSSTSEKAAAAFRDVAVSVVERARQTQTPIIVFVENQIQALTPDEFELAAAAQSSGRINGE